MKRNELLCDVGYPQWMPKPGILPHSQGFFVRINVGPTAHHDIVTHFVTLDKIAVESHRIHKYGEQKHDDLLFDTISVGHDSVSSILQLDLPVHSVYTISVETVKFPFLRVQNEIK